MSFIYIGNYIHKPYFYGDGSWNLPSNKLFM